MVAAALMHLETQGGNFAQARKGLLWCVGRFQRGWAAGSGVQAHVNTRRARHAMAGEAVAGQHGQHGFFDAPDQFLDEIARAAQIDERIGHHLPRSVVGDLAAAVGGDDGDAVSLQHMLRFAGLPLRVHGRVLAQPKLIGRGSGARGGKRAHLGIGGGVIQQTLRAHHHLHLQHDLDHGVRGQLLVQGVELLAAGGRDGCRNAQVFAVAAVAQFNGCGIEGGVVFSDDFHNRMHKAVHIGAHDLDRKIAGVLNERFLPGSAVGGRGLCHGRSHFQVLGKVTPCWPWYLPPRSL